MRTLIYQSSCALIALWTLAIVALAVVYFATSANALQDVAAAATEEKRQLFGLSATFLAAIAGASFLAAWAAVVIPLSLIAVLARPSWPMTPVSENGAPIQIERRVPFIGEASPASAPPE